MKNIVKLLAIIALVAVIIACDTNGGDDNGSGHWLMISQTTYAATNGEVREDIFTASTSYNWIAYRYRNETDYEEEYTTFSNSTYSSNESCSEYHYTRNGQTSHSTTETLSKTSHDSSPPTLSSATSSTTSSYDLASGLTSSLRTISSGVTTGTFYSIELLSDSDGIKTYKYSVVGSNGYNIIKIQNGRTLETSYYDEDSVLLYTTTYRYPDHPEIRAKLPNFTLSSTQYYSSLYSIKSSYQTADAWLEKSEYDSYVEDDGFEWHSLYRVRTFLKIRVQTFNDGVLSSQTNYYYEKINFNENANDGYFMGSRIERWGDYKYYEDNGEINILSYTRIGGNATIPAQINGKPVTEIRSSAFKYCHKLASVTIPNSVTSGVSFEECWSLTSVTIPDSVTWIDLKNCISLTSVTIPDSVTWIDLKNCISLTSVTFQGTIPSDRFYSSAFVGDLEEKYLAGGAGTYTRPNGESETWTKQR